jgi:hypothetical protein
VPRGEHIRDVIRRVHAKFHEFSMHRDEYMNLSLFSFYEICRLAEQEFSRFDYMKDEVLDERIPTNLTSYFSDLYIICYEFSKMKNGQVQTTKAACSLLHGTFLH